MQNDTTLFKSLKIKFLVVISLLILAFLPRYILIQNTPENNKKIDLCIYINGGQLIRNNINPYNFNDKIELREKLRKDTTVNDPWVMEDQARWNFYASGNLPASLLYFGTIEYFADGNALFYRIFFAIIDSLLSVLIFFFIIRFWKIDNQKIKLFFAITLGLANPILFQWGVFIPEDKGFQILLMLASIYFAKNKKLLLSAIFLGLSISFKGLGIFILPLCVYYLLNTPKTFREISNKNSFKLTIKYCLIALVFTLVFFIPFIPEVLDMMKIRLNSNVSGDPSHSSIWRIIFKFYPNHWKLISNFFSLLLLSLTIFGLLKKKLPFEILICTLLLLFVDINLNVGSLDRMNIGFLLALLILGTTSIANKSISLNLWYLFVGIAALIIRVFEFFVGLGIDHEMFDSLFSLSFIILYFLTLVFTTFQFPRQFSIFGKLLLCVIIFALYFNIYILSKKSTKNRLAEEIILKVGMGKLNPDSLKLSKQEKELIRSIIIANPSKYNIAQKSIVANKTGLQILTQIGLGKMNIDSLIITDAQKEEIRSILKLNPNNYNAAQKALILEKSGVEILTEIGMGKKKAEDFKLSKEQFNQIDSLIKSNPNNYNSAQKSILLNRNN